MISWAAQLMDAIGQLPEEAFVRAVVCCAMCGVLLDSAEALASRHCYAEEGIFGGAIHWRIKAGARGKLFAAIAGPAYPYRAFLAIAAMQVACAVAVLMAPEASIYAIAAVLALRVLVSMRHGPCGSEGADHMLLIILASSLMYYFVSDPFAKRAVIWFLAAESLLAYGAAGLVKARHRDWRDGQALLYVFSTDIFNNSRLAGLLERRPWLGTAACWSVIVFECLFPLCIFGGVRWCALILGLGVLFHLAIAVSQGLNLFVFAFVATYPAVLLTAHDTSAWLAQKHAAIAAPAHTASHACRATHDGGIC